MTRNFYFFGNLFMGLSVIATFVFSVVFILIGRKVVFLDSFVGWFLVSGAIYIASGIFILIYFRYRGYKIALYTGMIALSTNILMMVLLYSTLVSGKASPLYMVALALTLLTGLIYATSIIFSNAGKSPWLKAAGILMLVIGLLFGGALLWSVGRFEQTAHTLQKIDQWTSVVRSLIPILFMIQFWRESKALNPAYHGGSTRFMENVFGLAGIVAFLLTAFFTGALAKDGFGSLTWDTVNARRADNLVAMSERRTYKAADGNSLEYLLMKPMEFDPGQKYPLVVCLPYGGYQAPAANLLAEDVNRRKYRAFLLIPHSNQGTSWGGVPEAFRMRPQDSLVYEVIRTLDEPAVDEDRIYVSGVSLGGYGSWQFISVHPEMFAAAIPVCGAGNPALASRIADVPVWAFHGAKDRNVPVTGSREMIEAIREAGGEPKYTEFGHLAHNIWHEVSKTPGLLDWLFKQKKD